MLFPQTHRSLFSHSVYVGEQKKKEKKDIVISFLLWVLSHMQLNLTLDNNYHCFSWINETGTRLYTIMPNTTSSISNLPVVFKWSSRFVWTKWKPLFRPRVMGAQGKEYLPCYSWSHCIVLDCKTKLNFLKQVIVTKISEWQCTSSPSSLYKNQVPCALPTAPAWVGVGLCLPRAWMSGMSL